MQIIEEMQNLRKGFFQAIALFTEFQHIRPPLNDLTARTTRNKFFYFLFCASPISRLGFWLGNAFLSLHGLRRYPDNSHRPTEPRTIATQDNSTATRATVMSGVKCGKVYTTFSCFL